MSFIKQFYGKSAPAAVKVPAAEQQKKYKRMRFETFLAGTLGYSLYYVCRTSLNVVKGGIIDDGFLTASQLGTIGSCLFFAYAIGKFINGFLVDYSNIKRFMATGLLVSALANFSLGALGMFSGGAGVATMTMFLVFAIIWGLNGWSQSMGAPCAIVGLTRWYPLKQRGTYYGFFSASHNIGEWLSYLFVGLLVSSAGWKWGFFGAAIAGIIGVLIIVFFLHDSTESKVLESVEVMSGEMTPEEYAAAKAQEVKEKKDTSAMQKQVLRNPGVWMLALASAFMYMSRYAVNSWGILFLEKTKGFTTVDASFIISINALLGIFGTVFSGWLSDTLFKGNRSVPAFAAGVLEAAGLALFLFGGPARWVNILAMVLFGLAIGVLISFLGGLMAIDIVPREATGAALGIVGMSSYLAAGIQDIVSGLFIDNMAARDAAGNIVQYDFSVVSIFWLACAVISFMIPLFIKKRKA